MKNMIKIPALLVGLMLIFAGTTQSAKAQQEDVSLQSFYDELSPYGQWIQDPQYGYVWRPDVDQDEFRPYYSNGRWAMTEYGNTWVSNYDWGWAPFHYGRWVYNRYNDWIWLPDTKWGPAWVSWRSGGGNYGWAPLGPSISIGINISRGGYRIPDMCWNFIPYGNIYSNNYNSYRNYDYGRNRVYIQNTVIINNTYVRNNNTYYTGPRAEDVRRATNQNVTVYNVNRSSRAGASRIDNNNVNIYTPRSTRDNGIAAPRNVVQGNISRGAVGRDNSNVNQNDSNAGNGNMSTRPSRGEAVSAPSGRDNDSTNSVNRNGGNDNRVNGNMSTRPGRGEVTGVQGGRDNTNSNNVDRNSGNDSRVNGNMSTRPGRGEVTGVQDGRRNDGRVIVTPEANREGVVGQRPSGFDRRTEGYSQPQRVDGSSQSSQEQPQQRVERSREVPQRQAEAQQQRAERPQPVQQVQPQPQQRTERSQAQPQQQRVERTQSAPPERSSSSSEGRGGGSSTESRGGGRPGRG